MRAAAIILAAGASRRMGRPKALLPLAEGDSETFLSHLVGCFGAGGVEEVVVVIGGPDSEELRAEVPAGARVVVNPDPSPGPISSVIAGLGAVSAGVDGVLVHPVDIPGLAMEDVKALVSAAERAPDADAVIPSVAGRRGHPVLLRPALVARVLERGVSTHLRAHLAEEGVNIAYVESANRGLRRDVDTPEDYRRWRAE